VDGTEVVQLYIVDTIAGVDVPNRKLKASKKLRVKAGDNATFKFPVSIQEIGLWNRKMEYVVEPGEFAVLIGRSATGYCWKRRLLRFLRGYFRQFSFSLVHSRGYSALYLHLTSYIVNYRDPLSSTSLLG
jgi:hypothetical protein